jgi:hypothetical protein
MLKENSKLSLAVAGVLLMALLALLTNTITGHKTFVDWEDHPFPIHESEKAASGPSARL